MLFGEREKAHPNSVTGLMDENADEVPMVVTTLAKDFISVTSARYDAGDEMWYLNQDPRG